MSEAFELSSVRQSFDQDCSKVTTLDSLVELEVRWLGRKGRLTEYLKQLSQLSIDEKRRVGKEANEFRDYAVGEIETRKRKFDEEKLYKELSAQTIDITLPGRSWPLGTTHPLTSVMQEVQSIFERMGFISVDGPEVENEFNNFEALNIPANHPARDMQDTFYLELPEEQLSLLPDADAQSSQVSRLLRTHTSPVQVRTLKAYPPPISMIAMGRVYRNEALDATHLAVFHQVEGLLVDEKVTFADLKGTLNHFAKEFYGSQVKTRFRPSYFPFTEPSAEMDISCFCNGAGCRVCKQTGWLEILGSGMVNPKVFEKVGVDPERYRGFAFGMGIERLAMFKYDLPDLRLLYENDMRFLRQF